MKKINRTPFDITDLTCARSDFERNRILFEWLCDDGDRAELYKEVSTLSPSQRTLAFRSRAHLQDDPAPSRGLPIEQGHSTAYLLTDRADIEYALTHPAEFGNAPYKELGTGTFMLALDPGGEPDDWHVEQRRVAEAVLPQCGRDDKLIGKLAAVACSEAEVVPLAGRFFDLATLAEQAAVRFCGLLFGFAGRDHGLLTEALHKAYRALNYQILGRHFVAEPGTLPDAQQAMGRLLTRAAELIDDYQRLDRYPPATPRPFDHHQDRRRLPEGVEPPSEFGLSGLEPVLCRLARYPGALSGQDLAVLAVGMMAGIVGNVQAGVCIAVDSILNSDKAVEDLVGHQAEPGQLCRNLIAAALRTNPPVAFLPRRACGKPKLPSGVAVPAGAECILAMGAASRPTCPYAPSKDCSYDTLTFGDATSAGAPRAPHWCLGEHLARPLIERIVWNILCLPGLAQRLDNVTGKPIRLEKLWGFACTRYPLLYKREKRLAQQPLNVVMRIKAPIPENAERLKRVIRDGAPRIERALRNARHLHFAWFELLDNDTKLALHTVYDGDFDAYIQHFALEVDDLFDQLFACIEGGPPLPVAEHPIEFVETIRRYNMVPVGGYFFSAYGNSEVPDILRGSWKERP